MQAGHRGPREFVLLIVKKYPNRRLYDTERSQYITQDELADHVRLGRDVRVLDARTDSDLTQVTLAQIVFEGASAKLLPASLLAELIRMDEDLLSEFLSRYMVWALEVYLQSRRPTLLRSLPFANLLPQFPTLTDWFRKEPRAKRRVAWEEAPPDNPENNVKALDDDAARPIEERSELDALRAEVDALRKIVMKRRPPSKLPQENEPTKTTRAKRARPGKSKD
jgi:polyhydroxyalkanoate synthesis repressor PhaR